MYARNNWRYGANLRRRGVYVPPYRRRAVGSYDPSADLSRHVEAEMARKPENKRPEVFDEFEDFLEDLG